jgi:hypothetical protein
VVATGCFIQAGNVAAGGIAIWNGTDWSDLGWGIDGIRDLSRRLQR